MNPNRHQNPKLQKSKCKIKYRSKTNVNVGSCRKKPRGENHEFLCQFLKKCLRK